MDENESEVGGYFSRNYRPATAPSADSSRARFRIAKYLEEYCDRDSGSFGKYIEKETGIKLVEYYATPYVPWEETLSKCTIEDFLDIITAIARYCPSRVVNKNRAPVKYVFTAFVERVFREQSLAYRLDDKGGVHPFIDAAFTAEISELLANFSKYDLSAARIHLLSAENALLSFQYNGRLAIRSIFDAIENVFKMICSGTTQMNSATIKDRFKPVVLSSLVDPHQQRFASKLVDSLVDWVDAGHFYRHEPGQPEPTEPSLPLSTLYVSQGFGFARWMGEIYFAQKAIAKP